MSNQQNRQEQNKLAANGRYNQAPNGSYHLHGQTPENGRYNPGANGGMKKTMGSSKKRKQVHKKKFKKTIKSKH